LAQAGSSQLFHLSFPGPFVLPCQRFA